MEQIKLTEKLFRIFTWSGIILGFLLLFLLSFWWLYPYNPLVLSNIKLDKTEVSRGEHIRVSADYCKNTNKETDLFISFVDGLINPVPVQVINLKKGCGNTSLSVYVPKALPTGKFKLSGVFRYKINPIRTIEVNHLTVEFTIIK
jgi:hypothetical protein